MNLFLKMKFKNKSLILSIVFIVIIQTILYISNSQKSSFRYFIWNIQEIKVGKLISISFISGLIMSTVLSKLISPNINSSSKGESGEEEEEEEKEDIDYYENNEENNEYYEMPPERDLRDTQPTISVNYRVIKNKAENEPKEIKQRSGDSRYQDDWENENTEW